MTYFAKYNLATGAFAGADSCPAGRVALQASEGVGVVGSTGDVLVPTVVDGEMVITIDLSPVRTFIQEAIDAAAGVFRSRFITVAPGQEMTYAFKAAEAKAWEPGAPDALFPFLVEEARATGKTIAETCENVRDNAALFIFLGSRIEGARIGAKQSVREAVNLKQMVEAASIDWEALTVL